MGKRTIKLTVKDEYVFGAGVPIGAAGSHDEVELEVTFVGDVWLGTSKYVTFRDALGQSPRLKMLLDSEMVRSVAEKDNGEIGETIVVSVPYASKLHAGNMSVTFTGYTVVTQTDGDVTTAYEDTCVHTTTAYFRVLPSDYVILDDGSFESEQGATLAQQVLDAANVIAGKMAAIDAATEAANEAAAETSALNEKVDDAVERLGELEGGLVQTTGNSETQVMSQKATTVAIGATKDEITKNMVLRQSANLCNPAELTTGYITATGEIKGSNYHKYTGLMPVNEGDDLTFYWISDGTIKIASAVHLCAYDDKGNVVESAGVSASTTTYTVPETIKNVIISCASTAVDFMVLKNYNGKPTEYIEYWNGGYAATEEFLNGLVHSKEEVNAMFAENSTDEIKQNMVLKISDNLCNPDEIQLGYVDTTGAFKTSNYRQHTGKIAVNEGDILYFYYAYSAQSCPAVTVMHICAFDSAGNAISGVGASEVTNYTVPAGVASIIVSWQTTQNGFMVLKSYENEPPSPIPYERPAYVATEEFLRGAVTWGVLDEEIKEKILDYNPIETDYINAEIERVKRETLRDDGVLNFIFSTDQHIGGYLEGIHTIQEVARVADLGQFDFVCMGGDMLQAGDTSWYSKEENGVLVQDLFVDKKDMVISNLTDFAHELKDIKCPVFYCLGNHDVCFGAYHGARNRNAYFGYKKGDEGYIDPNGQSLLPREFFRLTNNRLGETVVWDDNNAQCGYFYKDFARSKIRVIVLNSQDVFKDDGTVVNTVEDTSLNPLIQQKQLTWLCDKALNFMDKGEERSEWAVIIFSHANVILGALSGGSVGNEVCTLIRGVLGAFMTGGTYSGTTSADYQYDFSVNVDFTQQGAVDFICSINGHVHADTAMNIGELIPTSNIDRPCIQVSNASSITAQGGRYSESELADYFTVPERTEGTITTECFDVFSIDRNARKIKTIRFGAGEDREISY